MNRADLVTRVANDNDISKAAAGRILDSAFDAIIAAVKKGEDASFVGFGTFKLAKRAARKGHNPATGEAVKIPASKVPKFVPGAAFRNAVDPKRAARKAKK